jgi:hypothetical protein
MATRHFDTLFPIVAIVGLAFAVAWGSFHVLQSTGTFTSGAIQLGGSAAGFMGVFVTLIAWYNRLDARCSEDLAVEIARLLAATIVREGRDDVAALNTTYIDLRDSFVDSFRHQSRRWRRRLILEMRREAIRQVKLQYPHLKNWQPAEVEVETVVETA